MMPMPSMRFHHPELLNRTRAFVPYDGVAKAVKSPVSGLGAIGAVIRTAKNEKMATKEYVINRAVRTVNPSVSV